MEKKRAGQCIRLLVDNGFGWELYTTDGQELRFPPADSIGRTSDCGRGHYNVSCVDARHLSAYYDGELSADPRRLVAAHVERCEQCGRQLAAFDELSTMVDGLATPPAPAEMWASIERELDAANSVVRVRPATPWFRTPQSLAALAALVVIGLGLGFLATRSGTGHVRGDRLARYLDAFQEDAEDAQRVLIANYGAQAIDLAEAKKRLGYQPIVTGRLPEEYTLESVYVFEMECCSCVQYVCRRQNTEVVTIFEHRDGNASPLGDRPFIDVLYNGRHFRLAQLGGQLVASWNTRNNRRLTVVGARDIQEIGELMACLGAGEGDDEVSRISSIHGVAKSQTQLSD